MNKVLNVLRGYPKRYDFLKRVYGNTVGLWWLKEWYVKNIGFYNGRKRLKLIKVNKTDQLIRNHIKSQKPFALARYGSTEFRNMFSKNDLDLLCFYSGFFPNDDNLLEKFRHVYFESSKKINILETWNYKNHFRKKVALIKRLPNIEHVIEGLNYRFNRDSWVNELENKRVLVVHPFKKTIEAQYKKGGKLGILPKLKNFEVITAVQTIAGNPDPRFKNWFEALTYMKKEIDKKDFDIAIIGCGAYGLPLAAHVKSIGKQALHLAGSTQLIFGIKGKRWENGKSIKFGKEWIYPLKYDTPKNHNKIEGGCYW